MGRGTAADTGYVRRRRASSKMGTRWRESAEGSCPCRRLRMMLFTPGGIGGETKRVPAVIAEVAAGFTAHGQAFGARFHVVFVGKHVQNDPQNIAKQHWSADYGIYGICCHFRTRFCVDFDGIQAHKLTTIKHQKPSKSRQPEPNQNDFARCRASMLTTHTRRCM